jgi:hypothetical protein
VRPSTRIDDKDPKEADQHRAPVVRSHALLQDEPSHHRQEKRRREKQSLRGRHRQKIESPEGCDEADGADHRAEHDGVRTAVDLEQVAPPEQEDPDRKRSHCDRIAVERHLDDGMIGAQKLCEHVHRVQHEE